MLKPRVPKFRHELSVRLKEIIEIQVHGDTLFDPSQPQTENLVSVLPPQGGTPPTLAETFHAWQFDVSRINILSYLSNKLNRASS